MPKVLLQKGANVFFQRDSNFPPLHVVAEYGHFKMPKFLIPKGANVFVSVIAISHYFTWQQNMSNQKQFNSFVCISFGKQTARFFAFEKVGKQNNGMQF